MQEGAHCLCHQETKDSWFPSAEATRSLGQKSAPESGSQDKRKKTISLSAAP